MSARHKRNGAKKACLEDFDLNKIEISKAGRKIIKLSEEIEKKQKHLLLDEEQIEVEIVPRTRGFRSDILKCAKF